MSDEDSRFLWFLLKEPEPPLLCHLLAGRSGPNIWKSFNTCIVQREAPNTCLARKEKSPLPNTSSSWSSLPYLRNQLIDEWEGRVLWVHSVYFVHKSWFSHKMWPCIYYTNILTQILPVFSNSWCLFTCVYLNLYAETNGPFSRGSCMTTLS